MMATCPDQCEKDEYLSFDNLPKTLTIHERANGGVIVHHTSGHRGDDAPLLKSKNFGWDKEGGTYVRVWSRGANLSKLLRTHALEPAYVMRDVSEEFRGHCLLRPRCYLPADVFADINSAALACKFMWNKRACAWMKKMPIKKYRTKIFAMLDEATSRPVFGVDIHHGDIVKQSIQKQKNEELQSERFNDRFKRKRDDLMYRLELADRDEEYQRNSYEYGQLIKRMAEAGDYNYPDPPKLPEVPHRLRR